MHPRITDYTNWNAFHQSSQLSIHVQQEAILDVTGEKRASAAAVAPNGTGMGSSVN